MLNLVVWISFSSTPSFFMVEITESIAIDASDLALLTLPANTSTPISSTATSGSTDIVPVPETLIPPCTSLTLKESELATPFTVPPSANVEEEA